MVRLLAHTSAHPANLLDVVVAACDWLPAGLLIVADSGQLLYANDAGAQILEAQDGLAVNEGGEVIMGPGSEISLLSGGFSAMLAAARRRGGLVLTVARPSGRTPLTLTLRPTGGDRAPSRSGEAGPVLVLVHDSERADDAGLSGLREVYGLTVTEARLAALIMQGNTIEHCTGLLGIRRTTVKMHLRNLYGKTGVQRQSELVALLFTSFGGVRCSKTVPSAVGERDSQRQAVGASADLQSAREAC